MFRSKHVKTFYDSTQSQEFNSEVCSQEFHAAFHIKTPFDKALYLGSFWSDLSAVLDGTQSQQSKSDACAHEF